MSFRSSHKWKPSLLSISENNIGFVAVVDNTNMALYPDKRAKKNNLDVESSEIGDLELHDDDEEINNDTTLPQSPVALVTNIIRDEFDKDDLIDNNILENFDIDDIDDILWVSDRGGDAEEDDFFDVETSDKNIAVERKKKLPPQAVQGQAQPQHHSSIYNIRTKTTTTPAINPPKTINPKKKKKTYKKSFDRQWLDMDDDTVKFLSFLPAGKIDWRFMTQRALELN